jgi:Protein of unknown function (DUF2508).
MKLDIDRQVHKPFLFKSKTVVNSISNEEKELLKALYDARDEWLDAVASFEHAYEENLIDYFTYKMKACESRYSYFLKKARELGLKSSIPQDTDTILSYTEK